VRARARLIRGNKRDEYGGVASVSEVAGVRRRRPNRPSATRVPRWRVSRGGHGNQIDLYRGVEHTEASQKPTSLAAERAEGGRRKGGDMAATWALRSVCARGEEREDRRESGRV
jgi:hypothetical protein